MSKPAYFEAKPNKMFPQQLTDLLRFVKYPEPVACAVCGKKRKNHWTMLVKFRPHTEGFVTTIPSENIYGPYMPVCRQHFLSPVVNPFHLIAAAPFLLEVLEAIELALNPIIGQSWDARAILDRLDIYHDDLSDNALLQKLAQEAIKATHGLSVCPDCSGELPDNDFCHEHVPASRRLTCRECCEDCESLREKQTTEALQEAEAEAAYDLI
jgi:hypothetical protein